MSAGAGLGAHDTIAAIATAAGPGAVGIVRVSGPGARQILERVAGRGRWEPRRLSLATARDAAGAAIDQVLAVWMPGPSSFTGEDVGEIHGHGGAVNLSRLLRAVLDAGARQAEPGEFTRRAFENGKLDLTQAEGLLAVIEAGSERAHRLGQALLGGELKRAVTALRERVVGELAEVEVDIDFPEEGVELAAGRSERLASCARELEALVASGVAGRAVRDGISVALVGPVNAGKSSLFNRLVGRERALVAPEPGTTRDYVEAEVVWDGVPVTLVDTAGRRQAEPAEAELEARGIALGMGRAAEADLELVLVPAGEWAAGRRPEPGARRRVVVSKVDELPAGLEVGPGVVASSAVTGVGLAAVRALVAEWAAGNAGAGESALVVSERQRGLLAAALEALERARRIQSSGGGAELIAADLDECRTRLAEVLGEEVGDEMLDELFARFCIGK